MIELLSQSKEMNKSIIEVEGWAENLKKIRAFVSKELECQIPKKELHEIVLAIDEACQNIVRYAYDGGSDNLIRVQIAKHNQQLNINIYDSGNKVKLGTLKPKKLSEDISPGGLGLRLICKIMDTHEFVNSDLKGFTNHLKMSFNFDENLI